MRIYKFDFKTICSNLIISEYINFLDETIYTSELTITFLEEKKMLKTTHLKYI